MKECSEQSYKKVYKVKAQVTGTVMFHTDITGPVTDIRTKL